MTLEEMKSRTEEITQQVSEFERTELKLYAELGKKLLPELEESSEHAPLVTKLKVIGDRIASLRSECANLEEEYKKSIAERTCYACSFVSPEGARFCEECGAKLGEPPKEYCKACSTMNRPGQKFCGECGAKLEEA
ncbi:MAG: zinc ribbon domain-containing protein [Oscillospiraceae bacterium]|jgi:RNA polymerase subunit RPABC4/transcription elongation factor Spt4|nr:zinc ribbon domain-containing protein [Oscillospiraceae bacterium]